jgi:hypothetical protein
MVGLHMLFSIVNTLANLKISTNAFNILYYKRLTLSTLPWKQNRFLLGALVLVAIIRARICTHCVNIWAHRARTLYSLRYLTCSSIQGDDLHKLLQFNQNHVQPFSKKKTQLFILMPIWRTPIYIARMFIFTEQRPAMNKLLNTEYG